MALDTGAQKSRRAILAGALGGLGAAALGALGRPAAVLAAPNGNVQLGVSNSDNNAGSETRVTATSAITALSGYSPSSGTGIVGSTDTGSGVVGSGASTGTGVLGTSDSGYGVKGTSNSGTAVAALASGSAPGVSAQSGSGPGVQGVVVNTNASTFQDPSHSTGIVGMVGDLTNRANNTDETGMYGYCDTSANSVGVVGHSNVGTGVFGFGPTGVIGFGSWGVLGDVDVTDVGVYGNTGPDPAPSPGTGIGVAARAASTSQVALKVIGRAQFSRSGRTSVTAGHSSKAVTMAGVTTSSYVLATIQTNRAGYYVQAVVPAAGKFTIYLNKTVPGTTYVGFMVIN